METLTTRRLDLAPYDPARDLDALHAMFADPEWARGGYSTPSRNEQESIDRVEREFGDNGGWTWVLRRLFRPRHPDPRGSAPARIAM